MRTIDNVLITGGAGFVGSNIALYLRKDFPEAKITCLDNLKRRGSELLIPRLKEKGIGFVHGDVRSMEDLECIKKADYLIECSAEPSVLAGYDSPEYVINTNLKGTLNCLELARKRNSIFIFLSTSRVYPSARINSLNFKEGKTRFELEDAQKTPGVCAKGISEDFPLEGVRSLYGASKLSSEIMINEYCDAYGLNAVINRCGVITGPWQMGKVDQGVVVLWAARHYFKKGLSYIGYGGNGKQVRDIMHIHDLYRLIRMQMLDMPRFAGKTYNIGGGRECSVSLLELTKLCEKYTGNSIAIKPVPDDRKHDIRIYLTDTRRIGGECGWKPEYTPEMIVKDVVEWIRDNEEKLRVVLE